MVDSSSFNMQISPSNLVQHRKITLGTKSLLNDKVYEHNHWQIKSFRFFGIIIIVIIISEDLINCKNSTDCILLWKYVGFYWL